MSMKIVVSKNQAYIWPSAYLWCLSKTPNFALNQQNGPY